MAHLRFTQLLWEAVFLQDRIFLCQLLKNSGNNVSSCDEFDSQSTGPEVLKFSSHGHGPVAYQCCWSEIAALLVSQNPVCSWSYSKVAKEHLGSHFLHKKIENLVTQLVFLGSLCGCLHVLQFPFSLGNKHWDISSAHKTLSSILG